MTAIARSGWFGPACASLVASVILGGCGKANDPDEDPGVLREAVRIEGAPMCPWRNPAADVAVWFPGANRSDSEVRILSGLRPELNRRLGRTPTAEENALHIHRIWRDSEFLGEVAVRRVKGASGAVELAVALEPDGRVIRGVRVQRSRETDGVTAALGVAWLSGFSGKSTTDPLVPGSDLRAVPGDARLTAAAMADGVRSLLVLRELADAPGALRRPAPESAAGHLH